MPSAGVFTPLCLCVRLTGVGRGQGRRSARPFYTLRLPSTVFYRASSLSFFALILFYSHFRLYPAVCL